jgi:hypothetical protein
MENFFEWMVKPVPHDEVLIWFNMHNMHNEKIELYGDFFITLDNLISSTYFESKYPETFINLSVAQKIDHFNWCWNKTIEYFSKESIFFEKNGEHKDYFESFYIDTFYIVDGIPEIPILEFIVSLFNFNVQYSKSDLELLTTLYKLLDKNITN